MSLENEYYTEKQFLTKEKETLAKFEALNVEEMTEEQIAARNRGIKRCKETIKESEEILEEIKEELVEFINNGGEVSEKTKEEIRYFESFDVTFKIISNRNNEVYVEGYVTINDEEAEDVDWYYYNGQGFPTTQMFIEHDGVKISGATDQQRWEVEQFRGDYGQDEYWIDNCILQSDAEENRTYVRENVTLIINDGAKTELEIIPSTDADYWATLRFTFNGEHLTMGQLDDDIVSELASDIDSIYGDEEKYLIDGDIEREISKYYWSDDKFEKEMSDNLQEEILEKFESAYAKQLVADIGVYGIAHSIIKEDLLNSEDPVQAMNEGYLDKIASNWEQSFEDMDVAELYFMTSEDVENIIREEEL